MYIPHSIGELDIMGTLPQKCVAYITLVGESPKEEIWEFNIRIADENGKVLVNIKDFAVKQANVKQGNVKDETIQDIDDNILKDLLCKLETGKLNVNEVKQLLGGI
jgi:S-adenosylmethionine hydrolase